MGILQGSVLSPTLFLIFASELLEICEAPRERISGLGFVEDTTIIIYGTDASQNCRKLTETHEKCQDWAERSGAKFAPHKYELIHFKRGGKKPTTGIRINGIELKPVDSARILGVRVDSRLTWAKHAEVVKVKAESQTRALTRLTSSVWGASYHKSRTLYKQVVMPGLTYGAAIWKRPDTSGNKQQRMTVMFERIQNRCLRTITGAYRATPIEMIHSEALILPIKTALDRMILRDAERFETSGIKAIIEAACTHIKRNTRPNVGTRRYPPTNMEKTMVWKQAKQAETDCDGQTKAWTDVWAEKQWRDKWTTYQEAKRGETYPALQIQPKQHMEIHKVLRKAESSLLTQIRTGRIGLNQFLHRRGVPGFESPYCQCGEAEQTVQHILDCQQIGTSRIRLLQTAGTTDLKELLSTIRGTKALLKWWMESGFQMQFKLAAEALATENSENGELI